MLPALCAATGLLVVGGVVLLIVEFRRYRQDRSPAPPLAPEQAGRDHWSMFLLDLVACLSILAAVISWQASSAFGTAAGMDSQSVQQAASYQAAAAKWESIVEFEARITAQYQQYTLQAAQLRTQAAALRGSDPSTADLLLARARVDEAEASAFANAYLLAPPTSGPTPGSKVYDRRASQTLALQFDIEYRTLQAVAAQLRTQAATTRGRAQTLVLAGALLAVAIFFWTVCRLVRLHRRLPAGYIAVAAMAASFVLLLIAAVT
jgi:hypothetical protein